MSTPRRNSVLHWLDALPKRSPKSDAGARRTMRIPRFESLERRDLMTAVNMNPYDQLLLELVNRARANPGAEAALYGIDLNAGLAPGTISNTAKQPLAPNQLLINAAGAHSDDMLANNYFSHTNLSGQSPSDRAAAAGYSTWVGENIAWGGTTGSVNQVLHTLERHRNLFLSAGHRQNMLNAAYEEVGMGVRFGPYTHSNGTTYNSSMVTEKFGSPGIPPVVTGVVYTDASDGSSDDDNFYSVGEQIGSGTITATNISTGAVYTTDIGTSGGYALQVAAGTYDVVAVSGVDGSTYQVSNVVVSSSNVKVDFETTTAAAANTAPTIEQIGDVALLLAQTDFNTVVQATDADGDPVSLSVAVENLPAHLDQSLGLTTTSVSDNWGGLGEKWLAGNDNQSYYLTPAGQLFQWTGGGAGNVTGSLVASLDASFHQNLALLHSASSGLTSASANLTGSNLNVAATAQFDGVFVVTVTADDGVDSSQMSFQVSKGNQFYRSLDQSHGFYHNGNFYENWGGLQEKWVAGPGGVWYFITPDGQLFQYDGSSSTNLTGDFVAQLDAAAHERPWLLYDATDHYDDVEVELHFGDQFDDSEPDVTRRDQWLAFQSPTGISNHQSSWREARTSQEESSFGTDWGDNQGATQAATLLAPGSATAGGAHRNDLVFASTTASRQDELAVLEEATGLVDEVFSEWGI